MRKNLGSKITLKFGFKNKTFSGDKMCSVPFITSTSNGASSVSFIFSALQSFPKLKKNAKIEKKI